MQDRFKFRTYLPDLKFFKYWGWIKDSHYVDLCACGDYQKPELLEKYTNQCTGLKDKNGTLIYEGDVVYKKGSKNWKNEKLLSKVIWSSNSAAFMISDENGLHQMPMNSNNIEILGNIYETPELIGGAE